MFNTYKINKKEIYISNHMMNGYYLFKSLLKIIFSIDLFCLLLSAICRLKKTTLPFFLPVSLFIYLSIEKS